MLPRKNHSHSSRLQTGTCLRVQQVGLHATNVFRPVLNRLTTHMSISQEFRAFCITVFSNPTFQQLAPLLVFLLIPLLVLSLATAANGSFLSYSIAMVLESLGFVWGWSNGHSVPGPTTTHQRKKSKKSHHARTRTEQISSNGSAKHGAHADHPYVCNLRSLPTDSTKDKDYYPGLVNISGTYCFMNSTVQVCFIPK